MENLLDFVVYALSQLARSFGIALLLAYLLVAVEALAIWWRKQRPSSTTSSTNPKGSILSQQREVILYLNGKPLRVIPESVVASTSSEIAQVDQSLFSGIFTVVISVRQKSRTEPNVSIPLLYINLSVFPEILIVTNLVHSENIPSPISVTVDGIVISVSL